MYRITIAEGKEKQLLRHHPWVFTGAIARIEPKFEKADFAEVYTSDGTFIARGYYDEKSHIVLHLLTWSFVEKLGEDWIRSRIRDAIDRRKAFLTTESTTNAFRIIHGEADFLPGLAADVYGSMIRIIVSSRFANAFMPVIVDELWRILTPALISVAADPNYASAEGIGERTRFFVEGKERKEIEIEDRETRILENGIYYAVSPKKGQKSGFYCDQRDNRVIIEKYAKDRTCLDVCSYTGAFSLHLLKAGAKYVKAIDASETVLRHLLYQCHINEDKGTIPPSSRERLEIESGDCFELLRKQADGKFDLMVLDPPKLAKTKGQKDNAMKAYKDLNRVAMSKIRNNGIIATFSCSGALSREDFRTVLSWSAKDAGVEVQILETLSAGCDHPIRLSFPESEYLKGYVLRVIKEK